MKSEFIILHNPSSDHLEQIRELMCACEFHGHFNIVSKALENNNLFVLLHDYQPVGFLAYTMYKDHAKIDLLEIKKNHKGSGMGRKLEGYFNDYCLKQRASSITLLCAPNDSLGFWLKMGYRIDEDTMENNGIYMIKSL